MKPIIIYNVVNGSAEFKTVQEKLFKLGFYWHNQRIIDSVNVYNGDQNLILIAQNNAITWTNEKYGLNTIYSDYKKISCEEFLGN